jgi:hypothetical protein
VHIKFFVPEIIAPSTIIPKNAKNTAKTVANIVHQTGHYFEKLDGF